MPDAVLIEWENVLVDTASARRDALVGALAAEGVAFGERDWADRCADLAPADAVRTALANAGVVDDTISDLVAMRVPGLSPQTLAARFRLTWP